MNGSAATGHWSATPNSFSTTAMTSGVVTGVMRSTIELGNLVCMAIQSPRPGWTRSA